MDTTTKSKSTGSASLQGKLWGHRAKDWAEQESKSAPLFESILSNVRMDGSEISMLDIGCGSGVLCKMADDMGINITGFDASRALLDEAEKRLGKKVFYQGDMEELPFADEYFDVVSGVTSFQFAENPPAALKEAYRVLKKGGRFFIAMWGPPEKCEAVNILSVMKDVMPPPKDSTLPGTSALYEEGQLEKFISESGFKPIKRVNVTFSWEYENQEQLLKSLLSAGLSAIAIQHSGEEKVKDAFKSKLKPYTKNDGSISLTNTFTYAIATK
jgi:ubiquinone/menaquinone biosynthesis C-methylase UbiE